MLLWQLIFVQFIAFLLLVFLFRQFLYQQVTRALGRLQDLYQENLKREEELKTRREETEQMLKARIAQYSKEIGRLRAAAEAEAQKLHDEIVAKAKAEAKRIVAEAEAKEKRSRAILVSEVEEKALVLASDIMEHIFTKEAARGIHYQLIDEIIEEIGKSDGQRLQLDVETVEIAVPFPLTELQKETLKRILSTKMGQSVNVKETVDHGIVAGMVFKCENVVLDGSLKNKLRGALAYVRVSQSREL